MVHYFSDLIAFACLVVISEFNKFVLASIWRSVF